MIYVRLAYEDVEAAVDWLTRVLGLRETDRKANPDGAALVWLTSDGDDVVMVCPEVADQVSPRRLGGVSHRVNLYVADVDAHHGTAVAEGATVVRSLETMPWGDRRYELDDLGGHRWHVAQRLDG